MKRKFTHSLSLSSVILTSTLVPGLALAQLDPDEGDEVIIEEDDSDLDEEETVTEVTEVEESEEEDADADVDAAEEEEEPAIVAPPASELVAPSNEEKPIEPVEVAEIEPEPPAGSPNPRSDQVLAEQAIQAALADAPEEELSLTPLTFTASTFSRFEYREGYDDLNVSRDRYSEGDQVVFRTRLGIQTHSLPIGDRSDVYLQFTPQASGSWGTNGTIGEANLGIYEGYLMFRTQRMDVQLGRQMMNYGESLVIGDLDWDQAGRAFDGIRSHYKMNDGFLDLFITQVAAGTSSSGPGFLAGDELFWGAYLGIGEHITQSLALDVYFLGLSQFAEQGLSDSQTGTSYAMDSAHLFTGGIRIKQKVGFFDYRLEAGLQFGTTVSPPPPGFVGDTVAAVGQFAYQADGELGADLSSRTHLSLGGVLASGDDPSTSRSEGWNELYPTSHQFLGLMDVIGPRTNVASGNLKVTQRIFDSLSGEIDAHLFARLEREGLGSVGEPGLAGAELDVQLKQALGKFAQLRGLYGLFMPISSSYASDDLAHYLEMEAGVHF